MESVVSSDEEEEQSSKYDQDKQTPKHQSMNFIPEKEFQNNSKVNRLSQQSSREQESSQAESILKQNNQKNSPQNQAQMISNNNILNVDNFILNGNSQKLDRQRLSQLEYMTSAKNLNYLQQFGHQEPNNVAMNERKSSSNLQELNSLTIQESPQLNKKNSTRMLDVEQMLPFLSSMTSKKSQEFTIPFQQPSSEQKNYQSFKEHKRTKDNIDQDQDQSSPQQKQKKRISFFPQPPLQPVDNYQTPSVQNIQALDLQDKNEDSFIRSRQSSLKFQEFDKKISQKQNINQQNLKNKSIASISDKMMHHKNRQIVQLNTYQNLQYKKQDQISFNEKQNEEQNGGDENSQGELAYLEDFDRCQIFKKFFVHNNMDQVLKDIKNIQLKQKKQKMIQYQKRRRSHVILQFDSLSNKLVNQSPTNKSNKQSQLLQSLSKPTYLSYGVYMKNDNEFPISKS